MREVSQVSVQRQSKLGIGNQQPNLRHGISQDWNDDHVNKNALKSSTSIPYVELTVRKGTQGMDLKNTSQIQCLSRPKEADFTGSESGHALFKQMVGA